tara:strand:- start:13082 stop:13957 length:876 start_codon:yes stop_codon:yes gene_type:complete
VIIGNIKGGLGNQMFQYAFAYAVAKNNKTRLQLDISNFDSYGLRQYELGKYCINVEITSVSEVNRLKYKKESIFTRLFRQLARKEKPLATSYYREACFQFDNAAVNKLGAVYFDGYWQSEKYFSSYRADLLEHFSLKVPVHAKSKEYQQKIQTKQAVSVHIRRGDYVTNTRANEVHGLCSLEYYRKAVSFIQEREAQLHFFIFSDDLKWAKENLGFIDNVTFVELETDALDHEEMWLMSQCQHNIIANSSFSWWGAWLNENPNKMVIAPKQWFADTSIDTSDLMPDGWVRL